jgi:hypothetical protein
MVPPAPWLRLIPCTQRTPRLRARAEAGGGGAESRAAFGFTPPATTTTAAAAAAALLIHDTLSAHAYAYVLRFLLFPISTPRLAASGRHQFMYNEPLGLTAPQHTAVKT